MSSAAPSDTPRSWPNRLRGRWHPAEQFCLLVVLLGCGAIGTLPLFDGPGYEYALASGLLLPSAVAISSALVAARRARRYPATLRHAFAFGALTATLALSISLLHGLRAGFCDAWAGIEFFVLGPGVGALLAAVWGACMGALLRPLRRPWQTLWAVALALLAPLCGVGISLWRFYTSPMVFAFDPFVGYFAGTLYDTVISGSDRLQSYRLGSLGSLVAVFALARLLRRPEPGRYLPRPSRPRLVSALLFVGGIVTSTVVTVRGSELGHFQSAQSIIDALGARSEGERCNVIYSRDLLPRDAALLARECDAHVREIEDFFQTQGPRHVRVYLFNGPAQKGWLMGAANTYIAKPWRQEIYLQVAGFPHPVLGHELAHVIAGSFARGPLRVAGSLGGWWPDPGRIEGFAVAASPREDADLTPYEWTRAMADLKLLPSFANTFGLGFFAANSSTSYTAAGAFVAYLRQEQGAEALRRWYAGEDLSAITGSSLSAWEKRFDQFVRSVSISEAAMESARARFDRPSVFARRCPHEVDRLQQLGYSALGAHDLVLAQRSFDEVLRLDPHDLGARLELGSCMQRRGKLEESVAHYQQLARSAELRPQERAAALKRWADLELWQQHPERAEQLYEQVRPNTVDEDQLRQLDVKQLAARALKIAREPGEVTGDEDTSESVGRPLAYEAIAALLIGDPQQGPDLALASAKLAEWAASDPQDGLPHYLLGKNFLSLGRFEEAAEQLDLALDRKLQLPRVKREALHDRMILACAQNDRVHLEETFVALQADAAMPHAGKEGLLRFARRCGVDPDARAESAAASNAHAAPAPAVATQERCPEGMSPIEGGEFYVGSSPGEGIPEERPRFKTRLPDFCLDTREVTASQYDACVQTGQCSLPHGRQVTCNYLRPGRDDHPINCVDWDQAVAYCNAQGKRLPSEIEWEYAAKGGSENRLYSWGNENPEGRTCWNRGKSCPVGSYPAGAFGLFDMTGNVWEWTSSYFAPYPWPPESSPLRVYRGGSWSRRFEKWMTTTLRNRFTPKRWGSHLGLRCAQLASGAECPFGNDGHRGCQVSVLDLDCPEGQHFNGWRCAAEADPDCPEGATAVRGHGCVGANDSQYHGESEEQRERDVAAVTRRRSPEFDSDCVRYQAPRPHAFRYEGGTSPARNQVVSSQGCKNRDVGASWNSACCP